MRSLVIGVLLVAAAPVLAQTAKIDATLKDRIAALKYVQTLHDPETGAYKVQPKGKPSLRAINGAVKVYKYLNSVDLGMPFPAPEKAREFVLNCYNPTTGSFAEPGGQPDVTITSIGVMAAMELKVPHGKINRSLDYLLKNANGFEEIRIGGAAVEAWGVKLANIDLALWNQKADDFYRTLKGDAKDGGARDVGSYVAFKLRLGNTVTDLKKDIKTMQQGQREDGGWGKKDAKTSDLETTYRVMRAMHLANAQPLDVNGLREFLGKCRNPDGGFGTVPGEASSLSGVYYWTLISSWIRQER